MYIHTFIHMYICIKWVQFFIQNNLVSASASKFRKFETQCRCVKYFGFDVVSLNGFLTQYLDRPAFGGEKKAN